MGSFGSVRMVEHVKTGASSLDGLTGVEGFEFLSFF